MIGVPGPRKPAGRRGGGSGLAEPPCRPGRPGGSRARSAGQPAVGRGPRGMPRAESPSALPRRACTMMAAWAPVARRLPGRSESAAARATGTGSDSSPPQVKLESRGTGNPHGSAVRRDQRRSLIGGDSPPARVRTLVLRKGLHVAAFAGHSPLTDNGAHKNGDADAYQESSQCVPTGLFDRYRCHLAIRVHPLGHHRRQTETGTQGTKCARSLSTTETAASQR